MIEYNRHFIWLHSFTFVGNGLGIKINKNYKKKTQIDSQDGDSSVVAHSEIDFEEAVLNYSNFLDTTK